MANKHASLDALFTDIADAIREKTRDTATIVADDFPDVIRNNLTGGMYTFTIDETSYTCTAGTTWGQWALTSAGGIIISIDRDDMVQTYSGYLCKSSSETPEESVDVIVDGQAYVSKDISLSYSLENL